MSPSHVLGRDDVPLCMCHNCKKPILTREEIICIECAEVMAEGAYVGGQQDAKQDDY